MKNIIEEIPVDKIKKELNQDTFLRKTNFGSNELYVVTHHNAPNTMLEIGRLREIAFRTAGGGTGKEADIDEYDTSSHPYNQLIVWDPKNEIILGGYRYLLCKNAEVDENGDYILATTALFDFSERFKKEFSPYVLELGRSFVRPDFQSSKSGRKSLYTLDNLWDGLGALICENPGIKYFYGKMTMYQSYNKLARDYILYFLDKHFGDREALLTPKEPLLLHHPAKEVCKIFDADNFKDDYKSLFYEVRNLGENIPPLVNSYMNLSSTMRSFGTVLNREFGNVEETGILVTIADIYPSKTERHILSYKKEKDQ